jgi:hypothetical protein
MFLHIMFVFSQTTPLTKRIFDWRELAGQYSARSPESAIPCIQGPRFQFCLSKAIDATNFSFLQGHKFHFNSAIAVQPGSTVSSVSEFRPVSLLVTIFDQHPLWENVQIMMIKGALLPLAPLCKESRDMDNLFMLERGNQKSAATHDAEFNHLMKDEIQKGLALPLHLLAWEYIPNCAISPLGIIEQGTIGETDILIMKR